MYVWYCHGEVPVSIRCCLETYTFYFSESARFSHTHLVVNIIDIKSIDPSLIGLWKLCYMQRFYSMFFHSFIICHTETVWVVWRVIEWLIRQTVYHWSEYIQLVCCKCHSDSLCLKLHFSWQFPLPFFLEIEYDWSDLFVHTSVIFDWRFSPGSRVSASVYPAHLLRTSTRVNQTVQGPLYMYIAETCF